MKINTKLSWWAVSIIILLFVINIAAIQSPGSIDARNFEAVFRDIVARGHRFIPDCLNYLCPNNFILAKFPPGHFLLFYVSSFIFSPRALGVFMATKMLIFSFYILTLLALIWFAKTVLIKKLSTIWVVSVFVSLASLILNTQGLAYTDVLTFPFLIISIGCMFTRRYGIAGAFFAASCLIKWQPIILLPVFVTYILSIQSRQKWTMSLFRFGTGLVVPIIFLYPINHEIVSGLWFSLENAVSHRGTVALNIPWIMQQLSLKFFVLDAAGWPSPVVALLQLGAFVTCYGLVLWRLVRIKQFLMSLLMALGVYYLFAYGVHENHFIMGSIIALLQYIMHPTRQNFALLRIVDLINVFNMFVFYGLFGSPMIPRFILGVDITVLLACGISIAGILYFYFWMRSAIMVKQKT